MDIKNPSQKPNLKQCKGRNLKIPQYSALPRQRALILVAVLVSWCAIVFGADTAQSAPPYPIGVWGQFGVGHDIDPGVVANMGIVGIGISDDWAEVEPSPGVYDWSTLDAKIAEAKAAGFQYLSLAVTDSSSQTPQWLLDSLPPDQKVALIDPASSHDTFCQPILTVLPWNPTFHQARLDLIAAMGARYTNDPAIVAVNMASFANHNTQDWNIQDTVGTIVCPRCPQPPPTLCGTIVVDQPAQWLAAGWTEPTMLEIGKEMCDAAAAAFPNQNIKLPIGGLDITYLAFSGGTFTTLCRDIENYVYGNALLGIPPRPYSRRFYMQRNTVDANWGDGTQYDTYTPGFDSERYIKYMIRAHAAPLPPWTTPRQSGLQMVSAANLGDTTNCRQGGGTNGPCGPTCDPVCVMQASLDIARTYGTAFIEIWAQDDVDPDFYNMIRAATIAMGGTPRGRSTPTPTPSPSADLNVTVTDTGAVAGARDDYTIVVANDGPSSVTGAVIRDTFPSNFTGVTFTASQNGGASGFTQNGTGNINDTVTMPVGSTITYIASGTIPSSASGTLSNTATVTAPNGVTDPNPGNNSATDTSRITLQADLNVTVTDNKTSYRPGQRDTYTIVVWNFGPSNVTGARITDNFPSVFTGVTFTATQTGGASGFTASGTGNIGDTVTMPAGSRITYTASETISTSASGPLSNTATVTAPNGVTDPVPNNNSATDTDAQRR